MNTLAMYSVHFMRSTENFDYQTATSGLSGSLGEVNDVKMWGIGCFSRIKTVVCPRFRSDFGPRFRHKS